MSITKVAKLAGVSTATVSRVMNDAPNVSPDAVRSVLQVVKELKYQPRRSHKRSQQPQDVPARNLAALALVMPEVRAGFFPSLIQSFDAAATEVSHQVLMCNTDNSSAKQADVILHLIEKRVAGVALMPTTVGPPAAHQVRHLQSAGIPVVLLHREIEGADAPLVEMPYEEIGHRAGQAMIAAGHRRTAAFFSHDSAVTRKYEQGFRRSLAEQGWELPPDAVHFGSSSLGAAACDEHDAGMESAVKRLMTLPPGQRPTALFVPWESDAELIYFTLVSLGIRVPEDVSLITFGSSWRGSAICRRLCAITIDENEVGRMAAKLLIGMARDRKLRASQERHMIPLYRHQGQTLGPVPKQGGSAS